MASGPENLHFMFDRDFMELVWENGQILVKGGLSSRTRSYDHQKTPSFFTTSLYPSSEGHGLDAERDTRFTKKPRLDQGYINVDHVLVDSGVVKTLAKESNRLGSQYRPRDTESDHKKSSTGTVNFSNFVRPVSLLKSINDQISSQQGSTVIKPNETAPTTNRSIANKVDPAPVQVAKPDDQEALPDEHSEAFAPGYEFRNHGSDDQVLLHQTRSEKASKVKARKPNTVKSSEPLMVPSSSDVCSFGASNDPTYALRMRCDDQEDMEESADPCHENVEDEPNGTMKAKAARRALDRKKFRSTEVHNLTERKRRGKINKKMLALQELIPNCNKTDKASMLDDAIEYLKTLQLQLQVMSMGSRFCMPQMLLPNGLPHFSPMAAATMAMRALAGSGGIPQFPNNHQEADQGLPMSVSLASFLPPHSVQSNFLPHILRAPANLEHHQTQI